MTILQSGQIACISKPTARFMLAHPAHFVAQGFGSGLSPIVPGTVGTLFAWLSFNVLSTRWPYLFTTSTWAAIIIAGFLIGIWACHQTGQALGIPDHKSIVWDEVIAFWLILIFLTPGTFSTQCWAFFWFRFFDIVKPEPIRNVDRRFKGGFGVMADDIIAAFYTLLLIAVWRTVVHN